MLPRLKMAWVISWTPQVSIACDPQIVLGNFTKFNLHSTVGDDVIASLA